MVDEMKRTIKDSVFTLLFSRPEYVLALYRALHPEDDAVTPEDFHALTLESALVSSLYNDFGVQVRDLLIILMEAQSRFSPNLALRILLYLAETYDRYVKAHELNLHSTKAVKIPRPELYVVYTGVGKAPPFISLSGLFADKLEDAEENAKRQRELREKYGWIDLEVKVIRRSGKGDILDQYVRFCEIADESCKKYGPTLEAVKETIRRCMEEGALVEFLSEKQTEVESAMRHMFDEEEALRLHDIEIRREAALEAAREESEKGIRALVEALQSVSQSRDAVIKMVMDKFGLQPQTAADKVAQYWA